MAVLLLTIIAPDAVFFEGNVRSVVLPAERGEIEVLPEHADYATLLSEGTLGVHLESGEIKSFALQSKGLAEIAKNRVTVFADRIV